ncbi:MAG: M56 family metallopeptidase, partial [Phycisphaerae bacterium]|nr:M56 family metallopeptidase [Phycisphaerae bacterium]
MMMFLLDATVKGVIILGCAGALCVLFRRASAATRHLIWGLALASVIALPVLSFALPKLEARVLPASVFSTAPAEAPAEMAAARAFDAANVEAPALTSAAAATEAEPRVVSGTSVALTEAAGPMHWSRRVLLAWAIGALAACLPLMVGMISAWRMVRRARPVVAPAWDSLKRGLSRRLGLTQSVRLLESDQAIVPMTWGLRNPVILLPASAASWSFQRRRAVLLHELSHVKRGDCATQMLGRLACAVWWFNPLTWYAFRRLRIESERACDDLVLGSGLSASDYAGHLLDILRTLRSPRLLASVGVCMARWSRFEGRLRAILDSRCNRRGLSKAVAVVALVVVASFVPLLSATRLAAQAVEDSDVTAEAPAAEPAALDVEQLVEKLLSENEHERVPVVTALGQMGEGARAAVEPLIAALKDGDANVRLRAADALGKIQDARAIEPLTAALEDEDPSVRAVVAHALATIKGAEMGRARAAALG